MTAIVKKILQVGSKILEKTPIVNLVKAGILVGVSAFTCWVLIRRTKKMRHEDEDQVLFHSPVDEILRHNYVADPDAFDDLDPKAQEICRKLTKGWKRPKKNRKKNARKDKDNVRIVSLFDDEDFEKEVADPSPVYHSALDMVLDMDKKKKRWKDRKADPEKVAKAKENIRKHRMSGKSKMDKIRHEWETAGFNSKSVREKLDAIARELNLPVDDKDDDIPDSFRAANPSLF